MAFDLEQTSRTFASQLSELLNATVCSGPKLRSVVFPKYTVIGYNVSRDNVRGEGIPLRISRDPKFFLSLSFRLGPDDHEEFLMVLSSAMILSTEPEVTNDNMLLHYDYERHKGDGYPEAHLQVCASSEAWETAGRRHDGDVRLLNKLHLPVGGRRFRPTLEDIIEFLIVERLTQCRPNWKEAVENSRSSFREKQLRAAIRQHPDVARDQLQCDGHL